MSAASVALRLLLEGFAGMALLGGTTVPFDVNGTDGPADEAAAPARDTTGLPDRHPPATVPAACATIAFLDQDERPMVGIV